MSQRTITSLTGGHLTVDPQHDELILDCRKDCPDPQFFLHVQQGRPHFYVYRSRQQAYNQRMYELCEEITLADLQAEIRRVALTRAKARALRDALNLIVTGLNVSEGQALLRALTPLTPGCVTLVYDPYRQA